MKATIHEFGNGFPEVGDYVPGNDGELYHITAFIGPIHTGNSPGASSYIHARVELADWQGVAEEAVFPASARIETQEETT